MGKQRAFQEAKAVYPLLKPTRVAAFATTGDCVFVACYDQPVSVVLDNETDLHRMIQACEAALARHKQKG
jgi:hypothetical protein